MTLLMVWHAGTVPQYQDRFHALQQYFDDVTVVVPDGWREVDENPFPPDASGSTEFVRLSCLFPYHPYTMLYRGLGQLVADRNPDLIYVHEEPLAPVAAHAGFVARRAGIPYVIDSALTHKSWYFFGRNPIEQYVYRTASLVYYRNEHCKEFLEERGCPEDKLRGPMPNGVSERTFAPVPANEAEAFLDKVSRKKVSPKTNQGNGGEEHTPMRLGFAGQIRYGKGIDLLLRIPSMVPGTEVVLCGPMVDESYRQPLRETDNLQYLGDLAGEHMPAFYSACDVTALPSRRSGRWEESFGRVLTESIFCGTPSIGSDIGMINDIVGEEATFPEGNVDAFAELVKSMRDDSYRSALLKKQEHHANEYYTWSVIAETVWNDGRVLYAEDEREASRKTKS